MAIKLTMPTDVAATKPRKNGLTPREAIDFKFVLSPSEAIAIANDISATCLTVLII